MVFIVNAVLSSLLLILFKENDDKLFTRNHSPGENLRTEFSFVISRRE